jgi:hypothetical protein
MLNVKTIHLYKNSHFWVINKETWVRRSEIPGRNAGQTGETPVNYKDFPRKGRLFSREPPSIENSTKHFTAGFYRRTGFDRMRPRRDAYRVG